MMIPSEGELPRTAAQGTVPAVISVKGGKTMMNYMSMMPIQNIANLLAEDTGAPELRNPLNSGMKAKSWLNRLFGRKNREQ